MEDELNDFDPARRGMQASWLIKAAADILFGSIFAIIATVASNVLFGPWGLFVRHCYFVLICPKDFYNLLKGIILRPLFSPEYFGTAEESQAMVHSGFLLAGYSATLISLRLVPGLVWIMKICWNGTTWTLAASALSLTAGIIFFRGSAFALWLKISVQLLVWTVNAYYLSRIQLTELFHWLLKSNLIRFLTIVMRKFVRFCFWSPNPKTLPIFKFSKPTPMRQQLEIQKGQFRLLHIHRRVPFLELHAELRSYTLGEAPYYECISYCWGEREMVHEASCTQNANRKVLKGEKPHCCEPKPVEGTMHLIVLNGCQHYVPTNVYDILCRRSSFFRPGCIWIDSICINQIDKEEKNFQVPIMKDIYEQASHVYVCLGESKSAWLAFSMLNELILTFRFITPESFSEYVRSLQYLRLNGKSRALNARMEALFELFENRWSTRVWVFQEIVFARAITILHGDSMIMWEYFGILENILTDPRYHELIPAFTYTGEAFVDRPFPRQLNQFLAMDRMRRNRQALGVSFRMPLIDVLCLTSSLEATEPVDKVFAVLSCTIEFDYLKTMVDYTVPLSVTILRVANYHFDQGQLLETLHFAGIGWTDSLLNYPSWVVDWSISRLPGTLANSQYHTSQYHSATGRNSNMRRIAGDDHKIAIRGQVIDEIKFMTSICDVSKQVENTPTVLTGLDETLRWIKEAEEFIVEHSMNPYHTRYSQQELSEVLWRTLIGDRSQTSRPATPIRGKYFQSFRSFLLEFQDLSRKYGKDLPGLMQAIRDHGPFGNMTSPQRVGEMVRDMVGDESLFASRFYPRRLAATHMGYIGMVPKGTKKNDIIVLFYGAEVPFVLRPKLNNTEEGSELEYQIVGECYLHGAMDGEGLDIGHEEHDFVIF